MKLVIVRHGESVWNKENKFTGWCDVSLSDKGVEEAREAGRILKKYGYTFQVAYTSVLKRAIDTLQYILDEMEIDIPINYSYMLNERHYGALQGLNKDETKKNEEEKLGNLIYNIKVDEKTGEFIIVLGDKVLFRGIEGNFSILNLFSSLNIKYALQRVEELPNDSDEHLDEIKL